MKNGRILIVIIFVYLSLVSCSHVKYVRSVQRVSYQSFRTTFAQPDQAHPIPEESDIVLLYDISPKGDFNVVVYNRTDDIMVIDQTKSFFVSSNGKSQSYYDPIVRTISQTNSTSISQGVSVNVGSIANALGVRGALGTMLYGVNAGEGIANSVSVTEVVQMADQPTVSLAPKSYAAMSKTFVEPMIGRDQYYTNIEMTEHDTHCKFSFCISYSLDEGESYEKLVTDFYSNSCIVIPVSDGQINCALRAIYEMKPDAIYEPLWQLIFDDNVNSNNNIYMDGILFDYR